MRRSIIVFATAFVVAGAGCSTSARIPVHDEAAPASEPPPPAAVFHHRDNDRQSDRVTGDAVSVQITAPESAGDERPVRRLSLAEALDIALTQNVDLALARAERKIAWNKARASQGSLLPALRFGGRVKDEDGRVQGSFGDIKDDLDIDRHERGLGVMYRLNLGSQIHEALASQRDLDAAVLETLDAEQRLLLRVVELYQRLLLARIGVQIGEQLVEDSGKLARIASARVTSGIGLGSDVARAEAKLAADRLQLVRTGTFWKAASVALAEVLRLEPAELLHPEDSKLVPESLTPVEDDWNPAETAHLRPDVEAARRSHKAAAQRVRAAWWDLLGPDVAASWRRTYLGESRTAVESRTDLELFVSWTLSLDALARIGQRRAERTAAELRFRKIEDQALAEVEIARQEIHAALESIPLARGGLEAAEKNLRISLARYEAGTAMALEVLDAEDTRAQARLNLARSIVSFNLAQARLLAAAGVIQRDRLAREP